MNQLKNLVGTSIVATTAMTAFSYALSQLCKQNYREPERLAGTVFRQTKEKSKREALGWLAHYAVGVLWAIAYHRVSNVQNLGRPWRKPVVFGSVTGIISAGAWRIVLTRHHRATIQKDISFLIQLVPAHIVFGLALYAAQSKMERMEALMYCESK